MKFSTLALSLLSLGTLSLAVPHSGHRKTNAEPPTNTTSPTPPSAVPSTGLDETAGSAGTWNAIVDEDDPRTLDDLMAEMNLTTSDLKYVYNNTAFKGFSASLSSHCLNKLTTMSGWKTFEPEVDVKLHDQTTATWGLKRVSQNSTVSLKGHDVADFNFTSYQFNGQVNTLGAGVDIYVIDTGVNVQHIDFDGRARFGFAFDGLEEDDAGHGTHCAGTAASTTFGIAKAANIIAVKVLGGSGSGSTSDILAGIDWMIQNHQNRSQQANFRGSVASMSLGSVTTSTTMDLAVQQASAAGIHFSVAAGNENQVACNSSPALASKGSDVLSVGAVNVEDARSSFSNFGECVSVYAPGEDVTSTWIGGTDFINTISGTSMATPREFVLFISDFGGWRG